MLSDIECNIYKHIYIHTVQHYLLTTSEKRNKTLKWITYIIYIVLYKIGIHTYEPKNCAYILCTPTTYHLLDPLYIQYSNRKDAQHNTHHNPNTKIHLVEAIRVQTFQVRNKIVFEDKVVKVANFGNTVTGGFGTTIASPDTPHHTIVLCCDRWCYTNRKFNGIG